MKSARTFAVDKSASTSYAELLEFANSPRDLAANTQNVSFANLSFELVRALAHGENIALSESGMDCEIREKECTPKECSKFASMEELLAAVRNSNSKITLFSSGTTGKPKSVAHRAKTLAASAKVSAFHASDVWGFAFNAAHMAGLQVFFQALLNANPLYDIFSLQPREAQNTIQNYGITHISATPTFFRMLLENPIAFPSVKRITLGGERSDANIVGKLAKAFPNAKVSNIYASTEFGALLNSDGEYFRIPDNLKSLVKIENGELLVSENLLAESMVRVSPDGFYHTADLVEFAPESNTLFKFSGRKDGLVNTGGYKVNPQEVEEALQNLEGVEIAAVFARKSSVIGNILCADIKLAAGASLSETDIRLALSKSLQSYKVPRIINFAKSFALTKNGKLKR